MGDTRAKLLHGALETVRTHGLAGSTARAIAATAGVNQALIFYHFGTVDELLSAACTQGAQEQVALYRARFAEVTTVRELLELRRDLQSEQRANMIVLAHLLAGAQTDQALAPATAGGLDLWVREIEAVLARVLGATPLADAVDVPGLARAVAAAFIGLELYGGVDRDGADRAVDALDQLGALLALLDDLGPLTQRAVRNRLRRSRGPGEAAAPGVESRGPEDPTRAEPRRGGNRPKDRTKRRR
ncbi:MAG: TetR/AcrR family transcriptional regulator [Streptomycetaceae bacterium]|nr:TetR/AcrR family transcriptional regulator [Streptomycetaceae bacterium]